MKAAGLFALVVLVAVIVTTVLVVDYLAGELGVPHGVIVAVMWLAGVSVGTASR